MSTLKTAAVKHPSSSGTAITLDASDNVGIGTASPQKSLDVAGTFAISNSTTSYWDFDRDDSTGDLVISDTGSEKIRMLTGGGITFNGDTAAANALSDFETGSWTPTDGSGAGLSFSVSFAKYTKIGNVCHLQAYFTYPTTTNSNNTRINGLPFAAQTNGFAAFYVNSNGEVMAQIQEGQSYLRFKDLSNSTYINSSLSGRFIIFSGTYLTA